MIVRDALPADAAACQAIYAHHVLHGVGTFEETAPTVEEMARRIAEVGDRGLPWLLAEEGGVVRGYAYAAPFRLRAAYRYTVEDSIYLAPDAVGKGVGRALLGHLIGRCEAMGLRQMVAVIGDAENTGSIRLHTRCGFDRVGAFRAAGWKLGAWRDVIFMQRPLGPGDGEPPSAAGLPFVGA